MSRPHIRLSNGQQFYADQIDPEALDIVDIAHALAQMPRFMGRCREFYSVAQHCLLVSYLVPPEYALAGLLHDAAEAFTCDLATPVKADLADYRLLCKQYEFAVEQRFGVQFMTCDVVKQADLLALDYEGKLYVPGWECRHGFLENGALTVCCAASAGRLTRVFDWRQARDRFLRRYHGLRGQHR